MKNSFLFEFQKQLRGVSVLLLSALLVSHSAVRAETPDDQYVRIYGIVSDADSLATSGKTDSAVAKYREAQSILLNLRKAQPNWNSKVVLTRLNYVNERISTLTQPTVEPATPVPTAGSLGKSDSKLSGKAGGLPAGVQSKLLDAGVEPRRVFRMKPTAGEKQTATGTVKIGMGMGMGDQVQDIKMPAITLTLDFTPTSVSPEGDIAYEATILDFGVAENSSAVPGMAEAMKAFQGLKGIQIVGVMADRGFNRKSDVKIPGGVDSSMKPVVDQMKDSLANVQMLLPEESVGVGAQWEVKQKVKSQGMNMEQIVIYTLASVDGDILTIKGTVTQQAAAQKISNPAMPQVKVDLSKFTGSGTSVTTLDLAKIFPSRTEVENHLEMAMGTQAGGQKQTMTLKMDLSMKLEGK